MPSVVLEWLDLNCMQLTMEALSIDGTLLTETATVTATVKGADGNNLVGETWPVTLAYAGSGGNFAYTFLETLTPIEVGDELTILVDGDDGVRRKGHWNLTARVERRAS